MILYTRMSNVQFDEEQEFSQRHMAPQQSFLMRLAFKTGFVQTEKGALYLLLAVAGALLLIALFILFSGDGSAPSLNPYVEGQNVLLPPGDTTSSF